MTWIPAEERLPQESGLYLVTVYVFGRSIVTVDTWLNERQAWIINSLPVLAWMPLPEPYDLGANQ